MTDSMCRRLRSWHVTVTLQTFSSSCSAGELGWSLRPRLALRLGGGWGWDSDSDHSGDVPVSSASTSSSSCLVIRILTDQRIHIAEATYCHGEDHPNQSHLLSDTGASNLRCPMTIILSLSPKSCIS